MSDKKFTVPSGGRVRVELPAGAADIAKPDERRRSLIAADDDPTRYVFRDSPSVEVLDLGTRLVTEAPYSYRELSLFYPVSYDVSAIGPTDFGGPTLRLTAEQRAAVDAELLAGDPFGRTSVGGVSAPTVLALNRDAPLGQVPLDFYVNDDYFGTPHSLNTEGENEDWQWKGREVSSAGWSDEVTENGLAPHAGRYVKKGGRKFSSFYLLDYLRFWDWPLGTGENTWVYFTETPDPEGERVAPALKFPLRVFGVPVLYRPREESAARAMTQAGGPVLGGGPANYGWAIVQELGINFTARLPQIPLPGEPDAEEWLAMFPAAALRTLRRVSTWRSSDPSGFPAADETISWELIEGLRPKSQAEVVAEATALSQAQTSGGMGDTFTVEAPVTLGWVVQSAPPTGRLYGAVEVAGKVYYAWAD
ncbi:MAG: hypothetical protein ABW208_10120 [Pyrinomonadaceae bacterium]